MKSSIFVEEWRDIQGYEGLYQVSNLGKVRSLDRYVKGKSNTIHLIKGKLLKPNINPTTGYYMVGLCEDSVVKRYLVHRLVAQAFLPNPDNLPCVNHINECRWDSPVWNLEWCTHKYNVNYGSCRKKLSQNKRNNKLSKKINQYTLNGTLVKTWPSSMEISRILNYSYSNISKCCRGLRKTCYGYNWEYVNN